MPLLSTFGAASARSFGGIGAAAAGAGLDVDEVFSTYLYTGTGSTQTITNDIDLSGEGGLVWIKSRTDAYNHYLHDTTTSEPWHFLQINLTDARNTNTGNEDLTISAFNSDGFVVGSSSGVNNGWGGNNSDFTSWTFRKAPKFFDVQTWTGNNTSGRTISHNLGSVPGCIAVKRTSASDDWTVYHVGVGNTAILQFNKQNAAYTDSSFWNNTTPTATHFTVGDSNNVNASGETYVAYIWANNNNDGEFGPDADQDIIKCGSYEGTGNTSGPQINLGFEPQWILIKNMDVSSRPWVLIDSMRSLAAQNNDKIFEIDSSNAEEAGQYLDPLPTGFQPISADNKTNDASQTHVYIAIRRGSLKEPVSGADVFATGVVQNNTRKTLTNPLGHPSDWAFLQTSSGGNWIVQSRLTGRGDLKFNSSAAEVNNKGYGFANNTNYEADGTAAIGAYGWNFRRAPSFFDVATYDGNSQASAITVNHNLGVVPEMMWCKKRGATGDWMVYHKDLNGGTNPHTYRLRLNSTGGEGTGSGVWNAAPTATQFSVGTDLDVNSGENFIVYLFASLAGVSKVGSFTGTTSDLTIDCGFSSGARFVLIKLISGSGDWVLWDSTRGIVSGNDPYLLLNSTAAEVTNTDFIDPHSSGFTVTAGYQNNLSEYIFYAIA